MGKYRISFDRQHILFMYSFIYALFLSKPNNFLPDVRYFDKA